MVKYIHILIQKIISILKNYYWRVVYQNFRRKYNLPESFWFGGEAIMFYGDGEIEIGENSYIGRYSSIQVSKGYKVKIGKNVSMSHH